MPALSKCQQPLDSNSPGSDRLAFVRENNLFIVDLELGKEKQITADGQRNSVINGAPDWMHEEEFSFSRAFSWSADGQSLAYIRFDESRGRQFGRLRPCL